MVHLTMDGEASSRQYYFIDDQTPILRHPYWLGKQFLAPSDKVCAWTPLATDDCVYVAYYIFEYMGPYTV